MEIAPSLNALPELLDSLGITAVASQSNEHHALAAIEPEPDTRDPFDKMLLAQCEIEGLRLSTTDPALVHIRRSPNLSRYPAATNDRVWHQRGGLRRVMPLAIMISM